MWICDRENLKVITGSLKDLLINAGSLLMYDLFSENMVRNKVNFDAIEKLENNIDSFYCSYNELFAKLSFEEQIYAIHFVLSHMFDKKKKAPPLEMWMEAAIDILFNRVLSYILIVDDEMKRLVVKAYKEYFKKEKFEEFQDEYDKDDFEVIIYEKNAHKIKDNDEFWEHAIESLKDVVLFDRDFDLISIIENTNKENKELICNFLRINIEGQYLPAMKIEKKTIVKMINDLLDMKP